MKNLFLSLIATVSSSFLFADQVFLENPLSAQKWSTFQVNQHSLFNTSACVAHIKTENPDNRSLFLQVVVAKAKNGNLNPVVYIKNDSANGLLELQYAKLSVTVSGKVKDYILLPAGVEGKPTQEGLIAKIQNNTSLVAALKAGTSAKVTYLSYGKEIRRDSFKLIGSTAAINLLKQKCSY